MKNEQPKTFKFHFFPTKAQSSPSISLRSLWLCGTFYLSELLIIVSLVTSVINSSL